MSHEILEIEKVLQDNYISSVDLGMDCFEPLILHKLDSSRVEPAKPDRYDKMLRNRAISETYHMMVSRYKHLQSQMFGSVRKVSRSYVLMCCPL